LIRQWNHAEKRADVSRDTGYFWKISERLRLINNSMIVCGSASAARREIIAESTGAHQSLLKSIQIYWRIHRKLA